MTLLRTLLIMLLTLLPALPLRADKTLRGKLRTAASQVRECAACGRDSLDTICAPAADRVRLSGYDKPARLTGGKVSLSATASEPE